MPIINGRYYMNAQYGRGLERARAADEEARRLHGEPKPSWLDHFLGFVTQSATTQQGKEHGIIPEQRMTPGRFGLREATMKLLLRLLPLVFLPTVIGGAQHRTLAYEPATVELRGTLALEQKYGPPNYGENPESDEKVRVPILVLSEPVDVQGDPRSDLNGEAVRDVRKVQLVFKSRSYQRLVDKNVVATGTLFHAHTGHHYPDVLMNVSTIARLRQ